MARYLKGKIVVAVDRDKNSPDALRWATDNAIDKTQKITLLHVTECPESPRSRASSTDTFEEYRKKKDEYAKELFSPFRCFCARRCAMKVEEVLLEDSNVAKAIVDYVVANSSDVLVAGAAVKSGVIKAKEDVPSQLEKLAPDTCTVYIISKGKAVLSRGRILRPSNPNPRQQQLTNQTCNISDTDTNFLHKASTDHKFQLAPSDLGSRASNEIKAPLMINSLRSRDDDHGAPLAPVYDDAHIKLPFVWGRTSTGKSLGNNSLYESDITFVSSGRPRTERSSSLYDNLEYALSQRILNNSETNYKFSGGYSKTMSPDFSDTSSSSGESRISWSSQNLDDVESEMSRLKLELKQTMDMYGTACKAVSAKQKAKELCLWKQEEEQRIEGAWVVGEAAFQQAEKEKIKCKEEIEAAEVAQRIAEREAQKRRSAELMAYKESEAKKALDVLANHGVRYRRYTIEEIEVATEFFLRSRKIGEGGYGPVYKCYLDHTPVAIKVLRPDAAQGTSQFQQEVEILSCIRHPNIVLLLGACPEYGCLVYEYMANGSLEDRLFRRGNTPVLPWQLRFRIAADIATGLLFVHLTKPEPLVHRDLKPANILLDQNFVSKISDVGLARLVPSSTAGSVTQYRMTTPAGTFYYIDPEYQQTGMLGTKSDVYSFGIMLLQIITAKPPMALIHQVEGSIKRGTFAQILDPAVHDWPMEETLSLAKLALQCAELRRKDRPDIGTVVLPELNRLRAVAEKHMHGINLGAAQ